MINYAKAVNGMCDKLNALNAMGESFTIIAINNEIDLVNELCELGKLTPEQANDEFEIIYDALLDLWNDVK